MSRGKQHTDEVLLEAIARHASEKAIQALTRRYLDMIAEAVGQRLQIADSEALAATEQAFYKALHPADNRHLLIAVEDFPNWILVRAIRLTEPYIRIWCRDAYQRGTLAAGKNGRSLQVVKRRGPARQSD